MNTLEKVSSRTTRNSNIEILRFLLLCCIFIWHLIVHGLDFKNIGIYPYTYNIHLTIIAVVLLSPAVNCFMFISGWYGMKLRVKKVLMLSVVCILTSCLCSIINKSGALDMSGGGNNGTWIYLFPISNKLWWFVTAYMMVYFVSPFIETGLHTLDKKTILTSLIGMTAIEFFSLPVGTNWGSTFFGLLYIYIIARCMRTYNIEIEPNKSILIYIITILIMILLEEFVNDFVAKKERMWYMLNYNNPLIIIEAICLFYMVKATPKHCNNFLNRILSPCLCIYLIPEIIRPYKAIVGIYQNGIVYGIAVTVLFIISSLVAGHLIFFVARLVINPRIGWRATLY